MSRDQTNQPSPPAQAIEVLLHHKAFFVKRPANNAKKPKTGQVSWAKAGGVEEAWSMAKKNAGIK